MAQLNLAIAISGVDQGASSMLSRIQEGLGGLGNLATGALTVGLGAATAGIGAMVGGLAFAASEAMGAQDIMAQTVAAIKSTGGAAGMTAVQIADMATALSTQSRFSDDAIQQGENLLLTFTNIGKDVFPDATQAMIDMATALGTDAAGGAIQLGKALNDPTAGISALTRAGVTFTEEQKKLIEDLQATGDMAGAQRVILAELNKEFGGSAAASAETFGGKLEVMKNQLLNVAEAIGGPLLTVGEMLIDQFIVPAMPMVEALGNALAGNLTQAISDVTAMIQAGEAPIDILATAIGDMLPPELATLWQDFATNGIGALVPMVGQVAGQIKAQVQTWAQAFIDWIGPMIPPFLAEMAKLEMQWLSWLVAQIPPLLAQLQAWGQAFIVWIGPIIPPFLAKLGELAGQLWAWVQAQVPVWLAQLQAWGQAFIAWIGPMIPPFLAKLGELALQLWTWITGTALPGIIKQIATWEIAFINWIWPMIPPFLVKLGEFLGQFTAWIITTALPALITKIGEWITAFVNWVMKPGGAKDQLLPKLKEFLTAVSNFVTTDLIPGFIGFAISFVTSLMDGLGIKLPDLVQKAKDIGNAFIDAIKLAINSAVSGLIDSAVKAFEDTIAAIKERLGIHSPSTVMAEIGHNMMAGLSLGIADSMAMPTVALSATVRPLVTAAASPVTGGSTNYLTIQVDARGSTLSARQIEDAVERALQKSGYRADGRLRMGTS